MEIEIPQRLLDWAAASNEADRRWLSDLSLRVARLCDAWRLRLDRVIEGGTFAYVARVRTSDGGEAILKVAQTGPEFAETVAVMTAADGEGYVRVYEHDLELGGLLMEPLGADLATSLPADEAIGVLASVLVSAWRAPRPSVQFSDPREEKATELISLIESLWPTLGYPCSQAVVSQALRYAKRRVAAFDPERSVLCHGDPHAANVLRVLIARPGAESGFVLIDPGAFLADPAYDLGVALREWNCEVLADTDPCALVRSWCDQLSDATGVEARAIWEWAFTERVSSGLYLLRHGRSEGQAFLEAAERLLE